MRRGALLGLAAAALFGLSAPLAKVLLDSVPPVLLAGILYLGAAAGLWLHRLAKPQTIEARLATSDIPKLSIVVVVGGILGPLLMLLGLSRVTALAGSLLLNLEAPLTVLIAVAAFHEHLGRRTAAATAFIVGGAAILKIEPGAIGADGAGVLLLAGACACWALDNNLTQRLSLHDPFAIVRVKTLVAGSFNTALGLFLLRGQIPQVRYVAAAMALGSVSYGLSIVLDAYALRTVGAAREAALFATAPFVGALASLVVLQEPLRWYVVAAMLLMGIGVALLLQERHAHVHGHEALEHEHVHEHDEHHQHQHGPSDPDGQRHSHRHVHERLIHDHPHLPDAHHRHRH